MKKSHIYFGAALLFITAVLLYLFFAPVFLFNPSQINETSSYEESKSRINKLKASDGEDINPKCNTIFLDQGKKASKTIVLFHGFTNCPEQFRLLGERFFVQGYNVLIPRLPAHGLKDRLTGLPSRVSASFLSTFVKDVYGAVKGLGEQIEFAGISGGGVLAAWAAYYYKVSKVMIISPLFLPYDIPDWGLRPLVNLRPFLPDYYIWWDDETKEKIQGPDYAYPRFSLLGAISFLELGLKMRDSLNSNDAVLNSDLEIIHIYSENDIAVKNPFNKEIISRWGSKLPNAPQEFMFEAYYGFNHDIIDINQASAKPEIVYAKLIELMIN